MNRKIEIKVKFLDETKDQWEEIPVLEEMEYVPVTENSLLECKELVQKQMKSTFKFLAPFIDSVRVSFPDDQAFFIFKWDK